MSSPRSVPASLESLSTTMRSSIGRLDASSDLTASSVSSGVLKFSTTAAIL